MNWLSAILVSFLITVAAVGMAVTWVLWHSRNQGYFTPLWWWRHFVRFPLFYHGAGTAVIILSTAGFTQIWWAWNQF